MSKGSRHDADHATAVLVCAGCGTASTPGAKFCSECGARLDKSGAAATALRDRPAAPGAGVGAAFERRQVTVVFCDLVGSTSLATHVAPEDYRAILTEFHHSVANAMSEFDGYVARFLGDGELVFFGFPEAHEDDAERAICAALTTIERVGALQV